MSDSCRTVVIGSGPVGAVAALALLRKGIPVTMLESGVERPPGRLIRLMGKNVYRRRSEIPNANHVASDDPNTAWFHAFVPGGLSNYWAGAVPRFAPEDFTEGERLHERYRWPVSYEDLAPYYDYVEQLCGIAGSPYNVPNLPAGLVRDVRYLPASWQQVAAHASRRGHGLTLLPIAEVRPWMITPSGAAFNSYTQIVPLLQRFPHFELRIGAHAVRLDWDGGSRRITSVTYVDRGTRVEERLNTDAVVVAAGPLSSTKLLLDSTSADFPDGLGNSEGLLGHYLHDHLKDWCTFEIQLPLPRLSHNAYLTRAPYDRSSPLLAGGSTIGNASVRDKLLSIPGLKTRIFGAQIFSTMVPLQKNTVSLHPELKDEFGLPKLDIHISFDEDALANMDLARQTLLDTLEAAGYPGAIQWRMPALSPGTSVHFGGTIRMHSSPRYGMLNAWNRLYDVDNVVVADASAFPTGPEKNPTLTAMALAVRASARLTEDLRSGSVGRPTRVSPDLVRTASEVHEVSPGN